MYFNESYVKLFRLNHKENICHWVDPKDMLKGLPMSIRTKILLFSYYSIIKNIKILQIDATFTASLLTHIKLLRLKKDEVLYRQDDLANESKVYI